MTPEVASAIASAFGTEIQAKSTEDTPTVLIGSDGRSSGPQFVEAARQGLAATGCRVIDLGVVTTPTVGVMIGALNAAGAVVVTASHNPIEWNGIKCLDRNGLAPPPEDAGRIIARFKERRFELIPEDQRPESGSDSTGTRVHVDRVLEMVDTELIRKSGFTVVLDSVNASGGPAGLLLLEELGCTVIHLNAEQTGVFAHAPEPTRENLRDLADHVSRTSGVVCGFAQDPDADRLAIVDGSGNYIGEEYTLALAALRILQVRGGVPLAANLSTSRMVDDIAARFEGATVARTAVGEANVVAGMRECGAPLGGEGNGGVIVEAVGWVRDSIAAMGLVLELLASDGRSLGEIVDELPRYAMVKRKLDLSSIGGRDAIQPALDRMREHYAGERINDADGVRVDLEEGWVHLRASNTEPIIRVISESSTSEAAEQLADQVARASGLT
jgi:phosphomannomutase